MHQIELKIRGAWRLIVSLAIVIASGWQACECVAQSRAVDIIKLQTGATINGRIVEMETGEDGGVTRLQVVTGDEEVMTIPAEEVAEVILGDAKRFGITYDMGEGEQGDCERKGLCRRGIAFSFGAEYVNSDRLYGFGVHVQGGFHFNPQFEAGIGIRPGLHYNMRGGEWWGDTGAEMTCDDTWRSRYVAMPIYIFCKYDFTNRVVSPYVQLRAGGMIEGDGKAAYYERQYGEEAAEKNEAGASGSVYANAAVGIRIALRNATLSPYIGIGSTGSTQMSSGNAFIAGMTIEM